MLDYLSKEEISYLEDELKKYKNILIVGGTGTGKTTNLNNLVDIIPEDLTVWVVQQFSEIKSDRNNFLSLELNNNELGDTIKFLLIQERPDYIVVDEAFDNDFSELLNGISYKNKRILMTMYENDINKCLTNFSNKVLNNNKYLKSDLEIKNILGKELDLILHTERLSNGTRKLSMFEVHGYSDLTDVFILEKIDLFSN